MLNRRQLLLGVGAASLARPAAADGWTEVNSFLESVRAAGTVPGAALIASRNGKIAFERQVGTYYSFTRRDAPLDGRVLHPLYSYSKLVSSTVVVMAHQDGLVDYDTPVRTYLPEFTGGGKEKITLRHLLTHSAGIPSVPVGRADTEKDWQAAFQLLCAASTEWEPGSKTQYHGLTGMFMAAAVVRRLNGNKPWERICRERLFTPLDTKSLTFELPAADTPLALTPQPKEPPKQLRDVFPYAGHPAGGCFGTPADALKVLQLHLNGGTWHGKRLLTKKALAEMHTVQYRKEIEQARAAGMAPVHEPWGLGPLLRGDGPPGGGHGWFGFRDQPSPGVFGHAGIDTVIGVADPATGNALFFVTTDSPKTNPKTVELRNGVTDRVFAALDGTAPGNKR